MLDEKYTISFAPEEGQVSKLTMDLYKDELDNIGEIPENSIHIHTLFVFDQGDKIEAKVFIINTMNQNVNWKYVPFILSDDENRVFAEEIIELSAAGVTPPFNIRPYSIFFSKRADVDYSMLSDKCKVKISNQELKVKKSKSVPIDFIDPTIDFYERNIIEKHIESKPPIMEENIEVNIYKNSVDENGKNYVILIVSNGSEKNVAISNINIVFKNYSPFIQGFKKLEALPEVKAYSASVFKILINEEDIINKETKLEECTVTLQA